MMEKTLLVIGEEWKKLGRKKLYRQGDLSTDKERTIRIRTVEEKGILTIKGSASGLTRKEFEYEIPVDDALELLKMCEEPPVEKYRYTIVDKEQTWEVDEFLNRNSGLVVAEIELLTEEQVFEKPDWIREEISGDPKYYNSRLVKDPFSTWPK